MHHHLSHTAGTLRFGAGSQQLSPISATLIPDRWRALCTHCTQPCAAAALPMFSLDKAEASISASLNFRNLNRCPEVKHKILSPARKHCVPLGESWTIPACSPYKWLTSAKPSQHRSPPCSALPRAAGPILCPSLLSMEAPSAPKWLRPSRSASSRCVPARRDLKSQPN